MNVYTIRRRNLTGLIEKQFNGSHAALSHYIDVNSAQINRLFYEPAKGGRNLGDQLARYIEDKLELKSGWLDIPHWLIDSDPNTASTTPNNSFAVVKNLRQAVPYFNSLSSNRIVIYIDSDIIDDERALSSIIQDIALLDSIGVRIVLVHGSRVQIDRQLAILGQKPNYHNNIRITNDASLTAVKLAIGETRIRIEGLLSLGLANSPLDGARLAVVSGNAVVGRPIGVKDGVDFSFSGIIRHIETDFIDSWLNTNSIVLLSSLAYSPTGEIFNVHSLDVAVECATALSADKLILMSKQTLPKDPDGQRISVIDSNQPNKIQAHAGITRFIDAASYANQHGVARCHIIDGSINGALIAELFTQTGSGTMVTDGQQELLRPANLDDTAAILAIIRPLEERGSLVPRSKELIENYIEDYLVVEHEGQIIGCAALHPYTEQAIGEIACVAVTNEHQGHGIAHKLVSTLEQRAKRLNLNELFVLTTDTSQWFQRRHYHVAGVEVLPAQKRNLYDEKRNSRIYIKKI